MRNPQFIYHEIARAIDALLMIDNPHTYSSQMVRNFPASFVRIWYREDQEHNDHWIPIKISGHSLFSANIQTTILFIEDYIEITHFADEDIPLRVDFDLIDPNCWETLLRWMKDNLLTAQSTVFVGELANDPVCRN